MAKEGTMITTEELETVRKTTEELFSHLEIAGNFDLSEQENALDVVLETADSGIVIGYHGEVLEALQLILSLLVAKRLGRFVRVTVEVGDYRKNRSEYLQKLALSAKERAIAEQQEQAIHSLKSWERRIIHLLLQDDTQVTSESVGSGKERVLVVKPRPAPDGTGLHN